MTKYDTLEGAVKITDNNTSKLTDSTKSYYKKLSSDFISSVL